VAYGMYLSVISFGGVVSPFIGAWITERTGYSLPFYLTTLVGAVWLAAMLLIEYDDRAPADTAIRVDRGWRILFTASLISRYTVSGIYFFSTIFRSNFLSIYLKKSPRFSASKRQIGTYMTLVRLAVAASQAALGGICDSYGVRRMIVSGVSMMGATYLRLVYGRGIVLL